MRCRGGFVHVTKGKKQMAEGRRHSPRGADKRVNGAGEAAFRAGCFYGDSIGCGAVLRDL